MLPKSDICSLVMYVHEGPQATVYRSHITKLCMVPRLGSSVVRCWGGCPWKESSVFSSQQMSVPGHQ